LRVKLKTKAGILIGGEGKGFEIEKRKKESALGEDGVLLGLLGPRVHEGPVVLAPQRQAHDGAL
jgi:hypothetical protein